MDKPSPQFSTEINSSVENIIEIHVQGVEEEVNAHTSSFHLQGIYKDPSRDSRCSS